MLVSASQLTEHNYFTDQGNGTILLTIYLLCSTVIGSYICTATDTRATLVGVTTIYGLPPSPTVSKSNVKVDGSTVTVSLESIPNAVIIHYVLSLYK